MEPSLVSVQSANTCHKAAMHFLLCWIVISALVHLSEFLLFHLLGFILRGINTLMNQKKKKTIEVGNDVEGMSEKIREQERRCVYARTPCISNRPVMSVAFPAGAQICQYVPPIPLSSSTSPPLHCIDNVEYFARCGCLIGFECLLTKMLEQSSHPVYCPTHSRAIVLGLQPCCISKLPSYRCYLACVTLGQQIAELCVYECVCVHMFLYILHMCFSAFVYVCVPLNVVSVPSVLNFSSLQSTINMRA